MTFREMFLYFMGEIQNSLTYRNHSLMDTTRTETTHMDKTSSVATVRDVTIKGRGMSGKEAWKVLSGWRVRVSRLEVST